MTCVTHTKWLWKRVSLCIIHCYPKCYCHDVAGSIPSSISTLSALTYLGLYNNSLTGEFQYAHNYYENITMMYVFIWHVLSFLYYYVLNLVVIVCHYDVGIIPTSIGSFSALEYLYLNTNKLTGEVHNDNKCCNWCTMMTMMITWRWTCWWMIVVMHMMLTLVVIITCYLKIANIFSVVRQDLFHLLLAVYQLCHICNCTPISWQVKYTTYICKDLDNMMIVFLICVLWNIIPRYL